MNCRNWEESVYLYDELSTEERKQLDNHLPQCAECTLLFQRVQQMQTAVREASGDKAIIRDPVLLTAKIMRSLPTAYPSGTKWSAVFNALMNSLFTRYALGAVSLLLIFFFVNEQQTKTHLPKSEIVYSGSKASIPLNTKNFMKAITQDKPAESSLYLCIKSNQCDYGIVKMYKQKKNHGNI